VQLDKADIHKGVHGESGLPSTKLGKDKKNYQTFTLPQLESDPALCKRVAAIAIQNENLTEISRFLELCVNAEYINLNTNKIKEIPPWFCKTRYPHLWYLNLNINEIEQVDDAFGEHWPKMQVLRMDINNLSNIPSGVYRHMQGLKELAFYNNKGITTVPDELCSALTQLEYFSLSKTSITTLPLCILNLSASLQLFGLDDIDTLTDPPPHTITKGFNAKAYRQTATDVFSYYRNLAEQGGVLVDGIKVLLMGPSFAGKTSLMRSAVNNTTSMTREEERTRVTDVFRLSPSNNNSNSSNNSHSSFGSLKNVFSRSKKKVTTSQPVKALQVFDYGGHDEYHSSQHLFDSGDLTLIVFAYSLEHEVDEEAVRKWIHAMAAQSPGAVVRVVGTKADTCANEEIKKARRKALIACGECTMDGWPRPQR